MAGEQMATEMIKKDMLIGLNFSAGKVKEIILDERIKSEVKMLVTDFEIYDQEQTGLYLEGLVDNEVKRYEILKDAVYQLSEKKQMQIAPYDRCFESKSYWAKFLTLFAGPLMNFILAILLFFVIASFSGKPQDNNIIGGVLEYYPASYANLSAGDEILMIGDKEITDNASIKQAIASLDSYSDVLITVKRKQTGLEEQVLINLAIEFNQIGIANFSKEEIMVGQDGAKIGSVFGKSVDKLKPNDIITKIEYDGQSYEVNSWNDLVKHTTSLDGDQLRVTFLREGEVKTEFIHVWENKVLNSQAVNRMFISIGITSQMKYDFFYSLVNPFKETWTSFTQVLSVLGLLMGGSKQIGLNDLSGPVGIFNVIGQVRKQGILALFWFTAFLSVNVGILNLLPIPVLDGGRIVFISYEAITRKKISRKVENIIINIFFILMMLLMLYVTFNDILRLF